MKNKNEEHTKKSVTIVCFVLLFLLTVGCQTARTESQSILIFEGTVERLAPDSGILSGTLAVFRLARYRVERICNGNYKAKEIVVDHLILSGKELEGINVGDRVCVSVKSSKTIGTRYNADGIRNPSDVVATFFVAEQIKRLSNDDRCCSK
jgi:hypothetical protein